MQQGEGSIGTERIDRSIAAGPTSERRSIEPAVAGQGQTAWIGLRAVAAAECMENGKRTPRRDGKHDAIVVLPLGCAVQRATAVKNRIAHRPATSLCASKCVEGRQSTAG